LALERNFSASFSRDADHEPSFEIMTVTG